MQLRSQIPWHYPRTAVAQGLLGPFASGLTQVQALFAPRRMGKTELVRQDLTPLAEEAGFTVVYVSFWDAVDSPGDSILRAIGATERQMSSSHSISVAGTGGSRNVSHERDTETHAVTVSQALRAYLDQKSDSPVLLLLDEVQHLATRPAFEPYLYMLRTVLDEYKGRVYALFTGSSRDQLLSLFRRRNAPLFSAANTLTLPDLDSEFVRHMLAVFEQSGSPAIDEEDAIEVFHGLRRVPAHFHNLLQAMKAAGRNDIKVAAQEFLQQMADESDAASVYDGLALIERTLLLRIARNRSAALYSDSNKQLLAKELGQEHVADYQIQHALRRLRRDGLVSNIGHGQYVIEDPEMHDWLINEFGTVDGRPE
ncbi:hypothetical protein E4656_06580 [Natronospirillum operosum]|uniref:ATP-binding protein n=1 Tax=Natronospirillum operosum TaxID=2759953 RepID=A0A4Z0WBE6_9GAMM|nr:hypothetical protein [Natronospirillum operosum]TGG93855.1 hypothetical protein E4656_06580 [Natronospirillum operosum]